MNDEMEKWSEWARCCLAEEDEAPGARGKKLLKSASKVAELAALLKRLHDDLESAIESKTAEQRIAKTPATMKLFSRLLKLDAVLCSDAAEPLFSCMACLLPPLWVGEGHQAMRERCKAWCMERLHAASLGIGGERHGFGGLSCGEDLTVDLLYDCGFSHEEVLGSIMAEAASHVQEQVAGGGHARCGWGLEVAEVGSVLRRCGRQESGLILLEATRRVGVEMEGVQRGKGEEGGGGAGLVVDDGEAVGSRGMGRGWEEEEEEEEEEEDVSGVVDGHSNHQGGSRVAAMVEDLSLVRAARRVLQVAAAPSSHAQVKSLVKTCCDASQPWVSLGVEEALEGALQATGCFHPLVALALSELPYRRSGAPYPPRCPSGSQGRKSEWLWNEWSQFEGHNSSSSSSRDSWVRCRVHEDGDGVDADWPRACSIWIWEGPRALIATLEDAPGGGGRAELWTTAKVLSRRRRERARGLEAAQDVFDAARQQHQQQQQQQQHKQQRQREPASGRDDGGGFGGGGGGGDGDDAVRVVVGVGEKEQTRTADALSKHWNEARLASLVLAASLLGTAYLGSGDRKWIEEKLLAWAGGAGGDEPVVAKLIVLHVLREGMVAAGGGNGCEGGKGGSGSAVGAKRQREKEALGGRTVLESLWCVYAKVLTGMAGCGARAIQARKEDASQAANLLRGDARVHGMAVELAESFVVAESWEEDD